MLILIPGLLYLYDSEDSLNDAGLMYFTSRKFKT